jgi:streptogramin lyase
VFKEAMRTSSLSLVVGIAGLAGCASSQDPESNPENVGVVTAEVTLAPTSVKCINIKAVNGATTVNVPFNVVAGGTTTFSLTGLPLGSDTLSAQAYGVVCASIGTAMAAYVSDNVTATVSTTPSAVTLVMHAAGASGSTTATVTFPDPHGTVTEFSLYTAGANPNGITVGPDGNIWFTETDANKIGVLVLPYGYVNEYTLPSPASDPSGIVAGPDGYLWFGELAFGRVGRITPSGSITEFPTPSGNGTYDFTVGPDGNIWFTETLGNNVCRIVPLTGVISEFVVPTQGSAPIDITAGPDGNIWFTEGSANKIGRITPAGAITELAVPTISGFPTGIAVGPDGNLWFTEQLKNKIGRVTPAGGFTEFSIPSPGSVPVFIAAGPDGNLWFTERSPLNLVGRITTAGAMTHFEVPTPGGLSGNCSITAGPDGNVWFTEGSNNQIARLTP